jgi:hypothetical protein
MFATAPVPVRDRRLAQQLVDDAETARVARYRRARGLAHLLADAVARADSLARLETALRSAR